MKKKKKKKGVSRINNKYIENLKKKYNTFFIFFIFLIILKKIFLAIYISQ